MAEYIKTRVSQEQQETADWLKAEAEKAQADYDYVCKHGRKEGSKHPISDLKGVTHLLLGKSDFAWYLYNAYCAKYRI